MFTDGLQVKLPSGKTRFVFFFDHKYDKLKEKHDKRSIDSMYSISEAAKKLGVSRQSIYNRLERTELSGHVSETDKGKMLSVAGLEILRTLYNVRPDSQESVNKQQSDNNTTGSVQQPTCQTSVSGQPSDSQADSHIDSYTRSLEEQLDYIKSIVTEKDRQISAKDEQILILTRLTENSQILLKQEQDKNKLLIEAEQTYKKRSLWSFFGIK